jgi:hypothetical protein
VPTEACGSPAFAQYRVGDNGFQAWALTVLELSGNRIAAWNAFLDTEKLFPLFGLPLRLSARSERFADDRHGTSGASPAVQECAHTQENS